VDGNALTYDGYGLVSVDEWNGQQIQVVFLDKLRVEVNNALWKVQNEPPKMTLVAQIWMSFVSNAHIFSGKA
jgi:hypothetical protein